MPMDGSGTTFTEISYQMSSDLAVHVISRTGHGPNRWLRAWLEHRHLAPEIVTSRYEVAAGRNRSVERFLTKAVPDGAAFLLQLDEDMFPRPETDAILDLASGDLVYCGYPARDGHKGVYGDGMIAPGCLRMSARLLQQIDPPWFCPRWNHNRTEQIACEATHLMRAAQDRGYQCRIVGLIDHLVVAVLRANPARPTEPDLAMPADLSSNRDPLASTTFP